MGTTFHGPSPWPHITRAIRVRGPRHAAIAYLGEDAPALLPLRAGDLLVVNASRAAVRAHVTSPIALAYYVEAGVRVLSSPNLHAGVIATSRRAVIGSANASHSSTIADEAVVITDDPEIVAAAWTFIDGIDEITEVDQVFLDNASTEWQIGRSVPIPGIGGRMRAELDFLPARVTRMFLRHIVEYEPSPAEKQAWAATQAHRSGAATGPAATYQLEWFRPGDRRARLNRGDVVIFVTDDNEWIYPPAVVDSDAIAIPHTHKAFGHLLRTRADLQPLPVADAEQQLAALGHPNPRLATDHRIISASLRAALLRLWKL
ncbi:phosphatidylserine/phosphatidylglycerophosphate/cardiolipin synthase family protein [Rhodococcus sp. JS3073]|uniref:phosphatidylserine/phosphatidylglycerophosphate/ cardiolipin synthase family protein n=1 Tax=Rhodococcus sp. JS3073 TaxID=3002901 RepID=UPI0022866280|nr:phosphatidylserine/phosphatidylglycerophosphate/cardiolipin synthase family protein [Rhodococcus sp. JS3073]WAM19379.1 phosphatidylserine/phosphatidylglycerophosphate/cardiolipin synthase family protein [Rhodococcus sp. JS3073]